MGSARLSRGIATPGRDSGPRRAGTRRGDRPGRARFRRRRMVDAAEDHRGRRILRRGGRPDPVPEPYGNPDRPAAADRRDARHPERRDARRAARRSLRHQHRAGRAYRRRRPDRGARFGASGGRGARRLRRGAAAVRSSLLAASQDRRHPAHRQHDDAAQRGHRGGHRHPPPGGGRDAAPSGRHGTGVLEPLPLSNAGRPPGNRARKAPCRPPGGCGFP